MRPRTIALLLTAVSWAAAAESDRINPPSWVRVSDDGAGFVQADDGRPFVPWGFNYDHDASGRLLEDYWEKEWPTVEEDFHEMRSLGANVVRVHLQFGRFMRSPDQPDAEALARLELLVKLAERTGLHLDVTGLGCYHRKDVPGWYDALEEARRWDAQAVFWSSIARICAASPAVFCYDLMNEPILPGAKPESDWLAGEFGGKHFVQRISLDLAGRRREDVARAWLEKLAGAIRAVDRRHLVTVGEIPWSLTFPGAKPLFSDRETGRVLDFASIHVYPKTGESERAMTALRSHALGRPVLIEEMFPLACTAAELEEFIARSRGVAAGWIGFYWGKLPAEYDRGASVAAAVTRDWLELFARRAPDFSRR